MNNNISESVVSEKTARLLVNNNFHVPVRSFYLDNKLHEDVNAKGDYNTPEWVFSARSIYTHDTISAPTIGLVSEWLKVNFDALIKYELTSASQYAFYAYNKSIYVYIDTFDSMDMGYEETIEFILDKTK